jgi:3-methylcrotonyl-CoA carboxylase beta subunit
MADESIMVRGNATIFLGGPPLVKAATGEEVTAEELGGAALHTTTSGVADHFAQNEPHALAIARDVLASINSPAPADRPWIGAAATASSLSPSPSLHFDPPLYPEHELRGAIPADPRTPFDVRAVLARVLDGSRFEEFKRNYGPTLVCGFGSVYGSPVGVVANNGVIFGDAAVKGAHFVQLCAQRGIPLLFLQNVTGFMVGKAAEAGGIAKHGAKMVMAVSNADVPKITVVIGMSYGAGNYGMCGRAFSPHFLFTWPNARVSVMGGDQAAGVLAQVERDKRRRALMMSGGKKGGGGAAAAATPPSEEEVWPAAEEESFRQAIRDRYDREGCPYYASARLWDDGAILPRDTRRVVGMALAASLQGYLGGGAGAGGGGGSAGGGGGGIVAGGWGLGDRNTSYGVFRM